MPARIREYFASALLLETPKPDDACFGKAQWRCLLSSDTMLQAAAELCAAQGFHTVVDNTCDEWDYRRAADYLLDRLRALTAEHERVCLLSAGELSVRIEGAAGVGGRNQQFALYCATQLQASEAVLSAGSDGIDGNSPAAGAVVDASPSSSRKRIARPVRPSRRSGSDSDSFAFFEQLVRCWVVLRPNRLRTSANPASPLAGPRETLRITDSQAGVVQWQNVSFPS